MSTQIKQYCNEHFYTDVHPYEVVEVLEKNWGFLTTGMENGNFQRMRFELVAERNFAEDKKELYTEKLLEAATSRFRMSQHPIYFYDYNF